MPSQHIFADVSIIYAKFHENLTKIFPNFKILFLKNQVSWGVVWYLVVKAKGCSFFYISFYDIIIFSFLMTSARFCKKKSNFSVMMTSSKLWANSFLSFYFHKNTGFNTKIHLKTIYNTFYPLEGSYRSIFKNDVICRIFGVIWRHLMSHDVWMIDVIVIDHLPI